MSDVIDRIWADLTAHTTATLATALWPLAVVVLCLAVPTLWHLTRHAVTIAHEAGHAAVGAFLGRKVRSIRLHADTSGLTTSVGSTKRLPLAMVAFAGYTTPAVVGLGAAAMLQSGRALGLLWVIAAVLVVVLVFIRNVYGFLVMVIAIAGMGWLAWAAPDSWRVGVVYGVTWLLLLGAVRAVIELRASRAKGASTGSDADALARLTRIPGGLWVALFWLVTVACAAGGAWLMVADVVVT